MVYEPYNLNVSDVELVYNVLIIKVGVDLSLYTENY
jgi:hypothetical protein